MRDSTIRCTIRCVSAAGLALAVFAAANPAVALQPPPAPSGPAPSGGEQGGESAPSGGEQGGELPSKGVNSVREARAKTPPAEEALRQRWEKLPLERRRELSRIYEHLQKLMPRERQLLLERLKGMDPERRREALRRAREKLDERITERPSRKARREILRKKWETLPPAERERIRRLTPEERRRYLEKMHSERRKTSLSRLPPRVREEAERLPPREQAELIRRFRGEQLLRETFRSPEEVEKLRELPPRRLAEILGFPPLGTPRGQGVARDAPREIEKPGLLSEETWKRWIELEPYERSRVLRLLIRPGSRR